MLIEQQIEKKIDAISTLGIDCATNQDIINWIINRADERTLEGVLSVLNKVEKEIIIKRGD